MTGPDLEGKRLAILLFQENGSPEDNAYIVSGLLRWTGAEYMLDMGENQLAPLPPQAIEQMEVVEDPDLKNMLEGADYYIRTLLTDEDLADIQNEQQGNTHSGLLGPDGNPI